MVCAFLSREKLPIGFFHMVEQIEELGWRAKWGVFLLNARGFKLVFRKSTKR